ncbi:sensor histidine kinase [Herbaspirillum sp. LeCh32-8]|uniref:sensor histidine kinase n=1 Tax=Herbaspirillum sp. LeCh32-8 TaxID=2821356 RepID=UPI001AEB5047|nr:sensor histidine kinase [Herbaspirillum sp. LeCh32-8]MBP0597800.1 sensor histidine kinase [Herbaspirillum sp. LeCh32-8]
MIDSLRLRLLLWLLIPMTVYVGLSASDAYDNAVSSATLIQDRALVASARMMAGQVAWQDGAPVVSIPPAALEMFASPAQDAVYYQVLMDDNTLLAGRPDFPAEPDFAAIHPAYNTTDFDGRPLRVVSYIRALYDEGTLRMVAVSVGQTMQGHQQMISELWQPSLRRQLVLLLLAVALVVLGLTIELRPILSVKDELAARDPNSLTPLRAGQLQVELRPIVEAINQYIQRLNAQVTVQKRFVADAAHQLRTPLTVIDSQIQFARQLDDPARLPQVLAALHEGSRNMTDLTNKLLQLSQAEASNSSAFPRGPVDLVAVAATVLEELAGLALKKRIDLGMETELDSALVNGNEAQLAGMLMNLIDNALRYTPEGGKVTVGLAREVGEPAHYVASISDNGPGIPAEVRERVFERFYRNAAPDQPGSGLGLAIVREIVQASQGTITLDTPEDGSGLVATVRLPALPEDGQAQA